MRTPENHDHVIAYSFPFCTSTNRETCSWRFEITHATSVYTCICERENMSTNIPQRINGTKIMDRNTNLKSTKAPQTRKYCCRNIVLRKQFSTIVIPHFQSRKTQHATAEFRVERWP